MLHDIDGSSEDWELKGEGNANAVFAYKGDRADLVCFKRHILIGAGPSSFYYCDEDFNFNKHDVL